MTKIPPLVADIQGVRDVTLFGRADADWWTRWLKSRGHAPLVTDGHAAIMVVAAEMKFWGVRFREVSVSVAIEPPGQRPAGAADAPADHTAFLVGAFNSVRFFAWSERTFFKTPYRHADVRLAPAPTVQAEVIERGTIRLVASMGDGGTADRSPLSRDSGGWRGRVYLPPRDSAARQRYFSAIIDGLTEVYPFLPDHDRVELDPASGSDATTALAASNFTGQAWHIRPQCRHAKSKTVEGGGREWRVASG